MVRGRCLGGDSRADHFAKGVNSGYVPLGGVIVSSSIWESFAERGYPGGLTYWVIPWHALRA